MPETTPPPTSADELAVVYLRGRDVACCQCRRNRNGQTTAACPACGNVLVVGEADPVSRRAALRAMRWLGTIGMTIGLYSILYFAFMVVLLLLMKTPVRRADFLVVLLYAVPSSVLCLVGGVWVWLGSSRPARKGPITRRIVSRLGWGAWVMLIGLLGLMTMDLVKIVIRTMS